VEEGWNNPDSASCKNLLPLDSRVPFVRRRKKRFIRISVGEETGRDNGPLNLPLECLRMMRETKTQVCNNNSLHLMKHLSSFHFDPDIWGELLLLFFAN